VLEVKVSIVELVRKHVAKGMVQILLGEASWFQQNRFRQLKKVCLLLGLGPIARK
jgi:hypothetical protein